MNVLEELESLGAVGNSAVEEEDDFVPVLAPILPPPPSSAESSEVTSAPPLVSEAKLEDILNVCDKILQVFDILSRANGELISTVQSLRGMISELRSPDSALPEEAVPQPAQSVTVPLPKYTSVSLPEPDEIPIDISMFDLSDLEPSVPLPPELEGDLEPISRTIPASPAPPPPPPIDPQTADQQLVEQAMREMGLRS